MLAGESGDGFPVDVSGTVSAPAWRRDRHQRFSTHSDGPSLRGQKSGGWRPNQSRKRLAIWSGMFSGVTTTTEEDDATDDAGKSL
jgi:hypothetical protein